MPVVSVIVPVYNKGKYISRCIESIKNQSVTDWELILIDDCSTDNSMVVMNDYARIDSRIIVKHQEENHGPMIARRLGDEMAKGDYITYCDADDCLPKTALQTLYEEAVRTEADIVSGNYEYIKTDGTKKQTAFSLNYGNDKEGVFKSLLKKQMGHNLCSKLFHSSLLKKYNYEVIDHMTNAEDAYMFYQIMLNMHKMVQIPAVVYNYIQTPGSSTQSEYSEKALDNICKFVSLRIKFIPLFPNLQSDIISYVSVILVNLKYRGYKKRIVLKQLLKKYDLRHYCSTKIIIQYHPIIDTIKLLVKNSIPSIKYYIWQPRFLFISLLRKMGFWLPDRLYLKIMYYLKTGHRLNLRHPRTFGEKIQWLKLYNRKPEYTIMVDKYAVKDYVAERIGEKYIIPTLGVWDKPEDINFDELPNQFVLKTTHGGGSCGVIICKDKSTFNVKAAILSLKTAMKQNIYKAYREWAYKDVTPRIIAEKYLSDWDGELYDYKIFTFNGEPKMIELDYNRFKGHQRNLYDFNWNKIETTIEYPSDPTKEFCKPERLDDLFELSKRLSIDIPHVRTDFYIVNDQIYFGELTFYPDSGFGRISSNELDFQMGDWINLCEQSMIL